jgi:hypothetical protein
VGARLCIVFSFLVTTVVIDDSFVYACSLASCSDPAGAIAYLQTAALQFFQDEYVSGTGEEGVSCEWRMF